MDVYEPIMGAFPIAKKLWRTIVENKGLPSPDAVAKMLESMGLEKLFLGKGLGVFRNNFVIALLIPRENMIVVDFISATGDLSDALELIAYYDREIDCYVVEIIPANELEYEENLGVEPVIIDAKTFELKSYPVLGEFKQGKKTIILKVDNETYKLWKESGKLNVCPVCGGELRWRGRRAVCTDCGVEVVIDEER
ncbi:zinc ribbon domain-containing protein [Pyrococcus kukulkanii]|uniref:Membrane protein n=1 Tax=Pyrococcus kukulkanii TaxID=1609559 RepID=A0A127B915_9EURY|nr:zinc ribbon domain-containing protein [Pyrococcus kukulkanii]AMM53116.1 membrane protein [Pyrococcus kukulkanii]